MEILQHVFSPISMHIAQDSLEYIVTASWSKYKKTALFIKLFSPDMGGKVVRGLKCHLWAQSAELGLLV